MRGLRSCGVPSCAALQQFAKYPSLYQKMSIPMKQDFPVTTSLVLLFSPWKHVSFHYHFRSADGKWMADTCWANPERLHHKHWCLTSPTDFWSGVRVAPPGSQSCPWASPWATSFLQLRRGPGDTLLPAATAHSLRGSGGLRQQVSWRGRSGNKNCRKCWTFSMV